MPVARETFDFLRSVGGTPLTAAPLLGGPAELCWNFGVVADPEATESYVATLAHATAAEAAPGLAGTGEGKDVFSWELEESVLGRRLPAWNQGSIGSCVSMGWGRMAQDILLSQCAAGLS